MNIAQTSYAPSRPMVGVLIVARLAIEACAAVLAAHAMALRAAEAAYHGRIPTGALNRVLRDAQAAHPPPIDRRKRPRILYATQGASDPPTFTLFATRPLSEQYLRYLERKLRESFDLGPTPVKLRVRTRNS